MSLGQNQWDFDILKHVFIERDALLIAIISINGEEKDSWYWCPDRCGNYTVKSAYQIIQPTPITDVFSDKYGLWHKLWNLEIPPKVRNFL